MKEEVGVAILGAGFVGGRVHAPSFRQIPSAKLVAIVDSNEERAKRLSDKLGVRYYINHMQMLENKDVEAVVVAVPTPYHFETVLDVVRAGKHVLCEMPLAPRITEVKKMREEAEKIGVILMPVLNFRFTPNYVKVKELLDEGAIGKPVAVHFEEFIAFKDLISQWPGGSWAWDVEKSGGYPDFTLSVWSIDLIRWLLESDISEVIWRSNYTPSEEHDGVYGYNTVGLLKFDNGAIGSLRYSSTLTSAASTSCLQIFGDGNSNIHAKWNNSVILYSENPDKREWLFRETGPRVWGHYQIDDHFIQCILGNQEPKIVVEDAIKAQEIALKMVKRP